VEKDEHTEIKTLSVGLLHGVGATPSACLACPLDWRELPIQSHLHHIYSYFALLNFMPIIFLVY